MNWKKAGMIAGAAAGVFLGMKYVFPVMLPFFFGWILAEAVYPAASFLAKRKISRHMRFTESGIGAAIILALTAAGAGGLLMGADYLTGKLGECIKYYPVIKAQAGNFIKQCCVGAERLTGIPAKESSAYVYEQISAMGKYLLKDGKGMDTAVDSVKWCVLVIGMLMIVIVSSILFLQEREKIKGFLTQRKLYQKIRHLVSELLWGAKAYIKAQVKIMAVVCGICIAGLGILKVHNFLWFGLAIGVLDALPVLGTGTFLIPAGLILLIQGNTWQGVGFFLLYLITAAARQLIEPRLVGSHVGVSPLLVLVSVYLGLLVYGGFGFILGPLSGLLLYGICKEWNLLDF